MIALIRVILLTASIIAGEAGPISGGAEVAIARTMANRVAAGETNVLAAYYARGPITTEAVMAATMLVLRPGLLADGVYRYVYSDDDRQRMGWREGDKRICGGGFCVNLSREWPGHSG